MIYLTETDFKDRISQSILNQIVDSAEHDVLSRIESKAIGVVADRLGGMYDITAEINKTIDETADNRNQQLVMWVLAVALYELYRIVPDDQVPPRIIKDYDDTMESITHISRGKVPTSLTPLNDTAGNTRRVFRMASATPRNHNMLN